MPNIEAIRDVVSHVCSNISIADSQVYRIHAEADKSGRISVTITPSSPGKFVSADILHQRMEQLVDRIRELLEDPDGTIYSGKPFRTSAPRFFHSACTFQLTESSAVSTNA